MSPAVVKTELAAYFNTDRRYAPILQGRGATDVGSSIPQNMKGYCNQFIDHVSAKAVFPPWET